MTREEWTSLPLKIALGLIYDVSTHVRNMPMPEVPRPPRYDGRLSKKGGYVWMSEMTLESLIWWHTKKAESAEAGTEFSERDGKVANTLAKWIEWRSVSPAEVWSGTRGEDRATAAAPSREPELQAWNNGGKSSDKGKSNGSSSKGTETKGEGYGDDEYE